ncbi:hypothetical protein TrCOL_g2388 [Triparma columacea]|uniref:Uncharacterized protein n=1 Tax=Triparma columacea TaxID=722753 RepID=A0A9W7GGF3_9STRA|nr:hypothetical protein TrCOL_g2388 [Triparma columacea]
MEAITDVDVTLVCPTRCGQGGSEACTGEGEGEFHNDLITMLQGMGVEDVVSVGWGGGAEVAMEWAGEVNRTEVGGGGGLKLRGVGVMDPQEKGDGGSLSFGPSWFRSSYRILWVYYNLYLPSLSGKSTLPLERGWQDDVRDLKFTHGLGVQVMKEDNGRVLKWTSSSRLAPVGEGLGVGGWRGSVDCWEFSGESGTCSGAERRLGGVRKWRKKVYGGKSRLGVPIEALVGTFYKVDGSTGKMTGEQREGETS